MLPSITLLLVYQLIGEVTAKMFDLPLPGPVVGMALLFATLMVRGGVPDNLNETASGLLQHLSLLFVPAGVGVMVHLNVVAAEWQAISVALVASTLLTIIVTALVMRGVAKLTGEDVAGDGSDGGGDGGSDSDELADGPSPEARP